jgi:hypothetical protein
MAAISVNDLIQKKEAIEASKKAKYDIETSAGTMTVKLPTRAFILEAMALEDPDAYIIVNNVVEPDLKDSKLLKAYGCMEPTDIVDKIFEAGEVGAISLHIMKLAGNRKNIRSEVHEEVKN